ncbi:2-hydroxyacid dehydrogenase [Arthrobacter sp. ZBG10]|uniref:hydroxyacid dehydrogenase n=1 Tax=Arthrobacter sp. ZBG10 TaxID=1676590 RepID=UPI0006816B65|nr:hydroxyacid dehydrogenase [Arthrobacter sp. ZBG10]KNH18275.1 2-hydroxyacid dehydrogenase [Arthrobacter sp. ZBG10]
MSRETLNVALAMGPGVASRIFSAGHLESLPAGLRLLNHEPMEEFSSRRSLALLAETDILLTGWNCARVDATVLDAAPRLRHILHAGGTVKNHVDGACWARGVQVSTAAEANAIPVAEYTLAMILLANKRVLQIAGTLHREKAPVEPDGLFPDMGNYGKRVGIIGASKIGRHVIRLLQPFELDIVVADPFLSADEAKVLGVRAVGLEELMETSNVVSLHAPSLPSTLDLVNAGLIARMRTGTTFINTARGELVDQEALLARLERHELFAVLDVTTPWVLPPDSRFYANPNVLLTPHLAGSLGTELERLAATALAEAQRISRGEPLRFPVQDEDLAFTA